MSTAVSTKELSKIVFPTYAIGVLMGIGFLDLVLTAVLHAQGLIVELNPLMKVFIEKSEWLFALVKSTTLIAAWVVMASYAKVNVEFVKKVSIVGSLLYVTIWLAWFTFGKP